MRLALLVLAVPLALGACQRAKTTDTTAALSATLSAASTASPKVAAAVVTVNSKIAAASQKLANYCAVMRVGLAGASLFGSSNGAIAAARTVVADFCDAPPSDPVSAVVLVQAAISDLKAQGITAKSVQHLSLAQGRFAERRLMRLHLAAQRAR